MTIITPQLTSALRQHEKKGLNGSFLLQRIDPKDKNHQSLLDCAKILCTFNCNYEQASLLAREYTALVSRDRIHHTDWIPAQVFDSWERIETTSKGKSEGDKPDSSRSDTRTSEHYRPKYRIDYREVTHYESPQDQLFYITQRIMGQDVGERVVKTTAGIDWQYVPLEKDPWSFPEISELETSRAIATIQRSDVYRTWTGPSQEDRLLSISSKSTSQQSTKSSGQERSKESPLKRLRIAGSKLAKKSG